MNGIVLGTAMLMYSSAAVPAVDTPRLAPAALTFQLPDAAAVPLREQARPLWQRSSTAPVREERIAPRRSNTALRALAAGAGAGIGFMVGARVGWEVTPKRGPYDDTSGLKGMMIGAPIGAALGAVLGWHLTK